MRRRGGGDFQAAVAGNAAAGATAAAVAVVAAVGGASLFSAALDFAVVILRRRAPGAFGRLGSASFAASASAKRFVLLVGFGTIVRFGFDLKNRGREGSSGRRGQ